MGVRGEGQGWEKREQDGEKEGGDGRQSIPCDGRDGTECVRRYAIEAESQKTRQRP